MVLECSVKSSFKQACIVRQIYYFIVRWHKPDALASHDWQKEMIGYGNFAFATALVFLLSVWSISLILCPRHCTKNEVFH